MSFFSSFLNVIQVIVGFGFVIFWHELGHFLAARWAGVRVEQFSVGMGHALVSFRKGVGFKVGNTRKEYEAKTNPILERDGVVPAGVEGKFTEFQRGEAAKSIGVSETEYRIAWIPLGGYVKPTGQDDLRPAAQVSVDDPYAYGAKPVGKRMVIISAGVVMNVILAFALYVGLFLTGFNAPPALVGSVQPGSPAQRAGIRVGDQLVELNGAEPHDFTKVLMNVALLPGDASTSVTVRRPDGTLVTSKLTPSTTSERPDGLLAIGITPASTLGGLPDTKLNQELMARVDANHSPAASFVIKPGDRITAIAGHPVLKRKITITGNEFEIDPVEQLDAELQRAAGKPFDITVTSKPSGETRTEQVSGRLASRFSQKAFDLSGLTPRTIVRTVLDDSVAAHAGLRAGDRIVEMLVSRDVVQNPDAELFKSTLEKAGNEAAEVKLTLRRGASEIVKRTLKHDRTWRRNPVPLGIGYEADFSEPTVARTFVNPARPAMFDASPVANVTIASVDGTPIANWYELNTRIAAATAGGTMTFDFVDDADTHDVRSVVVTAQDVQQAKENRYVAEDLAFDDLSLKRVTKNPLTAAAWGYEETKYSLVQVYTTIRRLFGGSVPVSSLHGPVGIFSVGQSAADRGFDWFIWFMALISANLAVVNFLPVPIVDGGLFLFLLIEKLTGKPPSPKVQSFAQLVGLILIASVFLFVTYNDISSKL